MTNGFDSAWLEALRAASCQVPRKPRVPLFSGLVAVGSVTPDFFLHDAFRSHLTAQPPLLWQDALGWHLAGDTTNSLALLAKAMRQAGLAGAWRNEQLSVRDSMGQLAGSIERGAVRPLGISTQAVHLVGRASNGCFWVQQRALSKANDPGLWDTLMGGMVSANDTLEAALARETWEEAGLRMPDLLDLTYGGSINTYRPSDEGLGSGYLVEQIMWYHCIVPEHLKPVNQDGEVSQFELYSPHQLKMALESGQFTLEAGLILAEMLLQRNFSAV